MRAGMTSRLELAFSPCLLPSSISNLRHEQAQAEVGRMAKGDGAADLCGELDPERAREAPTAVVAGFGAEALKLDWAKPMRIVHSTPNAEYAVPVPLWHDGK